MSTSSERDRIDSLSEAIVAAENGPRPQDLEDAPLLVGWSLRPAGSLVVAEGEVSGHPLISAPWVTTSPILAWDPDAGWMRTRTRWYRLGAPADTGHIAVIKHAAQQYFAALRAQVLRGETET